MGMEGWEGPGACNLGMGTEGREGPGVCSWLLQEQNEATRHTAWSVSLHADGEHCSWPALTCRPWRVLRELAHCSGSLQDAVKVFAKVCIYSTSTIINKEHRICVSTNVEAVT